MTEEAVKKPSRRSWLGKRTCRRCGWTGERRTYFSHMPCFRADPPNPRRLCVNCFRRRLREFRVWAMSEIAAMEIARGREGRLAPRWGP